MNQYSSSCHFFHLDLDDFITLKTVESAPADAEGGAPGQNQFSGSSSPSGEGGAGTPEGAATSVGVAGDAVGGNPEGIAVAPGAAGQS